MSCLLRLVVLCCLISFYCVLLEYKIIFVMVVGLVIDGLGRIGCYLLVVKFLGFEVVILLCSIDFGVVIMIG